MFGELTTSELGLVVMGGVVLVGLLVGLLNIGRLLDEHFVTRDRFNALQDRVKSLEDKLN